MDQGISWGSAVRVDDISDDSYPYLPQVAYDHPYLYVIYVQALESGSRLLSSDVRFACSRDRGLTWTLPVVMSGNQCTGGRMVIGPDNEVYLVWRDHARGAIVGRRSLDHGASFEPEFVVGPIVDNQGGLPPGWRYRAENYPLFVDVDVADRPVVAVDRTDGAGRATLYVAWTERAPGLPAPITASIGESEPNDSYETADPIAIGNAFGGSIPSADLGGEDGGDYFAFQATQGMTIQISGTMSSSHPTDLLPFNIESEGPGGILQPVDYANYLGKNYPVLPFVFTIPATGKYFLHTPGSAQPSRSYQFRLQELQLASDQAAKDHRDVVLVSSSDGGATWSPKVRVNDDAPRFDNAFPAIAVDSRGRVHVSWYDRRHTTDPGSASVHTRWSWSSDGGQTFEPSEQLSTTASEYAPHLPGMEPPNDQWRIGGYQRLVPIGERVYALWSQMVGYSDADAYGAIIEPDGITSVLVSGLRAVRTTRGVRLWWHLSSHAGVVGARVHRAVDGGPEAIPAGGEIAPGQSLETWDDESVTAGHRYRYRVEVVTTSGESVWDGPIEMTIPAINPFGLRAVGPNPFDRSIAFDLSVTPGAVARVEVYDVAGKRVAILYGGRVGSGEERIVWGGRDERGQLVPPGLYLVSASAGAEAYLTRVVRVR